MLGLGNALPLSMKLGGESYPPILDDGNAPSWWDMAEKYMTKDGSNRASQWADRSGNNNHLLQAGADALKPIWSSDGVLFDGADDLMKAVGFTFVQPEMIYMVLKQVTWTANDRIFDGDSSTKVLFQSASSPDIKANSGQSSGAASGLLIDTFGIVRVLFNGGSSKLQVNEDAAITGNFGSADMDGFTLGATATGTFPSNIQVKEVILRKIVDTAPNDQIIYDYLKSKYSL